MRWKKPILCTFISVLTFSSILGNISCAYHKKSKNSFIQTVRHLRHLSNSPYHLKAVSYHEVGSEKIYDSAERHHLRHHHEMFLEEIPWPVKKEAVVHGDLILGGLMMVHEREDTITCGPVMPQGGIQALEAMLYTLDRLNNDPNPLLPGISLGAHILDDCDKDTYGLEMAVDFIKGKNRLE
ncbi:hypothetical protein HHI36_007582 [Cryptolaemus montrouzieri]|uniref:Receptor ligand binding region domain-containing protein n=1 Tax=Cryptolaemus montrouzieri TaxID=559131 RepID=A0ABD2MPY5_9CUCU